MKRIISVIFTLFIVIVLSTANTALAAQSGDYYYTDHGDGTCTITDYAGRSAVPTFPETLNSLIVTGIGLQVFRLHSGNQVYMSVSSVTIPDTVTTIEADV